MVIQYYRANFLVMDTVLSELYFIKNKNFTEKYDLVNFSHFNKTEICFYLGIFKEYLVSVCNE